MELLYLYLYLYLWKKSEVELCMVGWGLGGELWGSIMVYGLLWRGSTALAACSNERVMSKQSATVCLFGGAEPELTLAALSLQRDDNDEHLLALHP
jgi:hypothetical protein